MNLLRCRMCGGEIASPSAGAWLCTGCIVRGDRMAMSWPEFLAAHPEWRDRAKKHMGWFISRAGLGYA